MPSRNVARVRNGGKKKDSMNTSTVGALCEQMVVDHRYDKNGQAIIVPKVEHIDEKDGKYKQYALVSRRIFNAKHELIETKVDINSRPILRVFSEIVKYYPAHPERFSSLLVVSSPYMILYHHWKELEEYRDNTEDDETRMHLNFLLDFMDEELGEDSEKAERLTEIGHISFQLLWSIFRPGELVLHQVEREQQQLWRLTNMSYQQSNDDGRYLQLNLSCSNYDGTDVGRHEGSVRLLESAVGRVCPITTLSAYPLQFAKNSDEIMEKFTERGHKFLSLKGIHVRRYEGELQMLRRPPLDFFSNNRWEYAGVFTPYSVEGRIVIDTKTFMEENPYSTYYPKVYEYSNDDSEEEEEKSNNKVQPPVHTIKPWESDDPMLFPPFVHGFCPGIKQWCRFYVDRIYEAQWNPDCFKDLILPDLPKQVLRSLVSSHKYPQNGARDQQELKGKGLVVLLQGTPGTGKTLTAESAAEFTKRVLVVISSGELGTQVSNIDRNLTKYLQYAAIWGAIVLIDEADIFLEARQSGNLEQNSLVAVFLRQLEYFQGMVFLTTNRGTALDPAIKSRIHLFLHFAPPDIKTQETMWRLCLGKMNPDECELDVDRALKLVRKADMNGREISNAVNTICTLAREEGKKVSIEHFKMFIQVWECFQHDRQEGKGSIGKEGSSLRKAYQKEWLSPSDLLKWTVGVVGVLGVVCAWRWEIVPWK